MQARIVAANKKYLTLGICLNSRASYFSKEIELPEMDLEDLKTSEISVSSKTDFETVVKWMENRFIGLPQFHTSINLQVLKHQCLIENEKDELMLPEGMRNIEYIQSSKNLHQAITNINKTEGAKSFGLLYLKIKLLPKLLKDQLKDYSKGHRHLVYLIGSTIRVPVILALLSRKTSNHYESIAIGIKGVTNYNSILEVHAPQSTLEYQIKGGLRVSVEPEDLDHLFLNKIRPFINSDNLINQYLGQYLIPEKKEIIRKLCEFTFNGCKMPKDFNKQESVKPRTLLVAN